jgi:hypothetical protein
MVYPIPKIPGPTVSNSNQIRLGSAIFVIMIS